MNDLMDIDLTYCYNQQRILRFRNLGILTTEDAGRQLFQNEERETGIREVSAFLDRISVGTEQGLNALKASLESLRIASEMFPFFGRRK